MIADRTVKLLVIALRVRGFSPLSDATPAGLVVLTGSVFSAQPLRPLRLSGALFAAQAAIKRKGLNEPAIAGGILVAPGVSPGFERHSRHQARKAGDRNWLENHMRVKSLSPLTGLGIFSLFVPRAYARGY